jgi:hypothetical protein
MPDTTTKEPEDLREKILKKEATEALLSPTQELLVKNAMDEYWRVKSMELLEYMAKNNVECLYDNDQPSFWVSSGEYLTKEQLFQNFL